MGLADNAARAASAARSAGGTAADAAKAARGSATNKGAFKVTKPATTKPATNPATKPATTKPATKPATAATAKPASIQSQLGLQETLDIQGAQDVYNAGEALREFQRQQSQRQLTDALAEIDRASVSNYKDIANDYAARGMARSGGFMGAESEAMAGKARADAQAKQAVDDFLAQLKAQGTADLATLDTTKQRIMADYLARRFAPAQGG
jgi:hypothetical protein